MDPQTLPDIDCVYLYNAHPGTSCSRIKAFKSKYIFIFLVHINYNTDDTTYYAIDSLIISKQLNIYDNRLYIHIYPPPENGVISL